MFMPARKLNRDERGMSLVFVGLGLMGFVAATMLAIDVGMLMTARAQAQNSADAGAHAGAVALAYDDYFDRSSSGPAVTNAVNEALANKVMAGDVSVTPADVEFVNDPTGEPNRVRVHVYRDSAHENPLGTFIAKLFGKDTMDISAVATAEASPADVPSKCLPFTIPDRWNEITEPPFNALTSTYDLFARSGNSRGTPLAVQDEYPVVGSDNYAGYDPFDDRGTIIRLKSAVDTTVSPSVYNPIVVPGEGTGAENYRNAIVTGKCPILGWRTMLTLEPGNMVGPTKQGIEDLIALDPNAEWDRTCRCVVGSKFTPVTDSPRVATIPLYDPDYYERHQQTGRNVAFRVANYLGVFVEGMDGDEVIARITPAPGFRSGDTNIPNGMFLKTVRIVQ